MNTGTGMGYSYASPIIGHVSGVDSYGQLGSYSHGWDFSNPVNIPQLRESPNKRTYLEVESSAEHLKVVRPNGLPILLKIHLKAEQVNQDRVHLLKHRVMEQICGVLARLPALGRFLQAVKRAYQRSQISLQMLLLSCQKNRCFVQRTMPELMW